MGYSAPSPKGRYVEHVYGRPGVIIERGQKITSLGAAMREASQTLQRAEQGDFSENLKGKYADKLKEGIGESWKSLGQAADLYEPVGPVLVRYGEFLEQHKTYMDNIADDCDELWAKYESLEGDKDGPVTPEADGGFLGIGGHDADSPEAKKEAEDNQAKLAAYEEWEAKAIQWDARYDSWEEAFDEAASGITQGTSDKISDGFMEYFDNFVEILEVVALVVGVLALFLAGPFAAIALALAAAVLIAKTIQAANGHAKWSDVAWAAVDILPFGKLGKLGKLGTYVDEVGSLKKATGKIGLTGEGLQNLGAHGKDAWAMTKKVVGDGYPDLAKFSDFGKIRSTARGMEGNGAFNFAKATFENGNPGGAVDLISRNFTGKTVGEMNGLTAETGGEAFELVHGSFSAMQGTASTVTDVLGLADVKMDFNPFSKSDVRVLNFL